MKPASTALKAILNGQTNFRMADIWTFNLRNGVNLYYTGADINLTLGGTTFVCRDVLCTGGKLSSTTGLDVGEDEIDMDPDVGTSPSMVGGIPIRQAVIDGLFDRCIVTRQRLFMTTWGDTSPGAVTVFVGEVTEAQITQNTITLQSKDLRNLLNIFMPFRQYQPTCPWVFGDANCTFNRTTVSVNSVAAAGTTAWLIICSLTQGAGYFNNGTIKFTSGLNAGVSRSVKSWIAGQVQLVAPFPSVPAIGDDFTITPGCTKNFAGPTSSFNADAQNGSTQNFIITTLSNASGFFNGGTLQFTSGVNVGQIRTINSWSNGNAQCNTPFPQQPAIGDEVVLTSVSTNTQGSCTGFSNTANFGGMRFIPVPETSY